MKHRYRIKFYPSAISGCWFSFCVLIHNGEEVWMVNGSTNYYGIIGENNSIIYK